MQRLMLKSKIHRAVITDTALHYAGSLALDRRLMSAADILPGEQVHVLNINNGARLITYAMPAPAGSGTVGLRGAAARGGQAGDLVIVLTYAQVPDAEAAAFRSRTIAVDGRNRPVRRRRDS